MSTRRLRGWLKPSLGTLFARYFFATMLVELIIIIGFGFLVTKLYENSDRDGKLQFMNGTVTLIRQQLAQTPHKDWDGKLADIARAFSYPVKLIAHPPDDFEQEGHAALLGGRPYLDFDNQLLYVPLPHDPRLLLLGPLEAPASNSSWISEDMEILLLWILLTGSTLGTLIYFSLRPLWKDLLEVRRKAEVFADGDFSARAQPSKSRLLAPLSLAFNSMAARLERQMETRQALSHAIAHEIRTPIARLRFGLTMLEEEEDEQEWRRYREGMERDMQELEELFNTSMEFAKLNRNEVPLHWETVDLYDWFDDLIDLVTPLKPPGIKLELDCALGNGAFDRKLMYVASRNLLLNAFKYANTQVRLTVCHNAAGQLLIHVDDDGCGIPEAERDKVFEPFLRLDRSRDRATGGYGLGLSFVKLITEHHGGQASVAASELGGARFTLRIMQPQQ
ncbi:ATP-binding protein [Chromobacterium haemolyticum]|uniref:ATP-binding protein n=1 Tax=Chromobacterium haemolyticum TaxID=394935 RepID=UPI0009DAA7E3|nr:ATP-binding protein [Chromobacterium haemolyticum]OQS35115.1 two-component sensor histidine kinase [Chromobacterium haemolyticum]